MTGDNNRLYFKNYERRPDDEEFAEVMKIVKEEGAIISDKYIALDCGIRIALLEKVSLIFFIRLMEMELFSIQKVAKR